MTASEIKTIKKNAPALETYFKTTHEVVAQMGAIYDYLRTVSADASMEVKVPSFSDVEYLDKDQVFNRAFVSKVYLNKDTWLSVTTTALSYTNIEVVAYWNR